ncbi:MAG: serine hydrolase domain-containing protein, partial [Pseudomonadota bacterium]
VRSMTKPVTAIGLLILMERGHFHLSDPITEFLPEFEATETLADYDQAGALYTYPSLYPPTMEQLLSHTAGLAYWQANGGIIDQRLMAAEVDLSEDTQTLVRAAASYPYVAMPGSEWNYSLASDLQGAIIERITGQSLAKFLKQEIFDPLGMSDTGFYVSEAAMTRLSDVTVISGSGFDYVRSAPADHNAEREVYFEGGHGLYTTRRDYSKFLDAIRGDGTKGAVQLLTAKTLEQFRTNAIKYRGQPGRRRTYGGAAGLGFGLGVGIIEDPNIANLAAPVSTYYWYGALGTFFWIDPKNDITFIGMIQSQSDVEPDIMRAAMDAIYGQTYLDTPDPLSSRVRHASEGSG